ncbi:apicoplast ribosomal protein S5 (apicoplast) [Plasmodium yoelii]|uniref:Apicoplast ribosomal protein S5 n=2 Tax=Plasmodium yoelii TaxID=5861 RepID=A0AAE9WW58_PLAYO|nr:apicoplast ribosomal protein S5 [Plasmodium yoelii]WBY61406.1 apicoplast ribosomal protein S5 [Plasmodium yoelii yoelii]BAL70690.1 small subunit ribosomal protein 5 [Plasmodium yoelii]CDU21039.1 apicoplast ribosomal protein S5 [Plasmodium yoelii]VTZ82060.1 apicoplast ribosomal protein S5 [Plasmodium yoelii]|eukprot:XP_022811192.1 apicoplast ribosomal protein S5 (apicoplast) [Plasmodium yoelii]
MKNIFYNKKLYNNKNIYMLYYILIIFKSIFIILNFKSKCNKNYYLYNKIYNLLIIYIKVYYILNNLHYYNFDYNIYNMNYIYFYIYKYSSLNNKINIINNNSINIIEKIIEIKKISYTIKKGRIKRYKVILLIGNKQGWVGIGIGKHVNLNKAILSSKINSLNNIYYFKYSMLNMYKLKYIYINYNKIFLKLQFKISNYLNIRFLLFKYLFECLGYLNCKIIMYHNIINNKYNLLNKILLILFNLV